MKQENHPQIPVIRSSMPPYDEYIDEIRDIWETRWLTNSGEKHRRLEATMCDYLGISDVSLFVNGHQALEAALDVLDIKGEVITTPFTFASTTQAIVHRGLTPVFCDICADSYTIDASKIEALITEKTSAILPVHVFGNLCDWRVIDSIAEKYNLKVIYDAAHSFGMTDNGVCVGNIGHATMFSLHATKVFHAIEGGALVFSDSANHKKCAQWRNFGMNTPEEINMVGTNAKMSEFSAAMGLCNLRYVDAEITKRKAVSEKYRERLSGKSGIFLCDEKPGIRYNYGYFPIRITPDVFGRTRNDVAEALLKGKITARKYFYPLTSTFRAYEGLFHIQETPVAEIVAAQILTLPLYADLEFEDVNRICDIILGK